MPIVVWGAGGHAAVVAEAAVAAGISVLGFLDDTPEAVAPPGGARLLRDLGEVADLVPPVAVALGVGANDPRVRLAARVEAAGLGLATVVHPAAWVSPSATLGEGAVVMAGAVIQARARVGRAAIVNTSASVDHDCVLGVGAHLSPGAHLSGHVTLGDRAWVGTGASVRDRAVIGARTQVGVGAAVVSDLPADAVAFGVPARVRPVPLTP